MNETLPSQKNESKPWKRELTFHREGAGTLKPEEALALVGSFTESSLESYKDDNDSGELSDQQFGVKQRIHAAALEQLSTLELTEGTDALNAIVDRRKELETVLKTPHGGTRSHAETTNLRIAIEGVKLLNEMLINVEDSISLYAETEADGNKFSQRNRAAGINHLIERHNVEVGSDIESIANSPEAQEAQAKVDARFSEQAEEPQPTETVDDARHKVAEVFGDTKEIEYKALLAEVSRVAQGSTRIHTDIPKGVKLKSVSGDYYPIDGFNTFGDGAVQKSNHRYYKLRYEGSAESFMVEPATETRYKTVSEDVEVGGRFRKKTEKVEKQVHNGETPVFVVNPATGQQELGIKIGYQFNGSTRGGYGQSVQYEGPTYVTESRRGGNQLFVEAVVPKSIADKLEQAVKDSPETAREFAKTLALNNGITEQAWNNGVQPPFDELPDNWKMTIVEMQKDTQYGDERHSVISEQAVETNRQLF